MRKYAVLVAAVLMQMCLGATYAWSVFVGRIREFWDLGQGAAQWPFTLFYIVFPATAVLGGTLLGRYGPRVCAVAGGILFGCGWMVAGLGDSHFSLTVAGIGLLAGLGAGLAYLVPIQTGVLWFPRHKGLVTGIAVAGFGGGAALVASLSGRLMAGAGWNPFEVFTLLGVVFLAAVGLSGLVLKLPVGATLSGGPPLRARRLAAEARFRILYFAMFAGLVAGFTVNANLQALAPAGAGAGAAEAGGAAGAAVTGVALFALGNGAGRMMWGWVFDRLSAGILLPANLLAQALLLAGAGALNSTPRGFLLFSLLAGLNYGGVMVLYASAATAEWGAHRVGRVYGLLFSSNIPAAAAPALAGFVYDRTGSFLLPFGAIALLLFAAAVLTGHRRALSARTVSDGVPDALREGAPSPEA